MKILISGASGLYGSKLTQIIPKTHQVYSAYYRIKPTLGTLIRFDVSNKDQVEKAFEKINPEVVVHAAALTNVDKCETNKPLAWKVNVDGTRNMTEAAEKYNAFFLYLSTDYVFNGEKGSYIENDKPDPVNYYGLTKVKAEEIIQDMSGECCICRPSVIYGASPSAEKTNFALWLINKLRQDEQVKIVTDQWNSPTLDTNLAEMTWEIVQRRMTGVYHISGATSISRNDFAKAIASTFNLDSTLIMPSTSSDFSWIAKRPKDSSLNVEKAQKSLKKKPLTLEQALAQMRLEMLGHSHES